jgi:hypothetical protein
MDFIHHRSLRGIDMRLRRGSVFAALIVLLLAVGTAMAASPSLIPSLASSPPAGGGTNAPDNSASPSQSPAASESPESSGAPEAVESPEAEGSVAPSAAELARVVADLKAAGITATADQLQALAAKVGLGGAVRVMVIANASGKTTDEIVAMFQSGKGWGQIIKDLGLSINPGIGGIMSQGHGKGHGHGNAPNPSASPS